MKHVDAPSVHLGAHVTNVDPSLDADNGVRAGILWVDTSGPTLKYRNGTNDAWITILGGLADNVLTAGGAAVTAGGENVTVPSP
jgi:hypothetical protein